MNFNKETFSVKKGGLFTVLGRPYYINDTPAFTWSNSGIEFEAVCERFNIHFGENTADEPAFFKIYVDGKEQKACVSGKKSVAIIENLKDTRHKIKVIRISEGSKCITIESVDLFGKEPGLFKSEQTKKLRLEFLGDSITAGYGVIASGKELEYTTYEQDSTKTYAYLTSLALDAEIRTICISGEGVCHSCGEGVGTPFAEFFQRTTRGIPGGEKDDYVPDVFIINGGTNDKRSHVTSEEFKSGVKSLLQDVRERYPNVPIIWMYGMMLHVFDEELREAIEEFSKAYGNVHLLIVKAVTDYKNQTGTYGHPNYNASKRCSALLVKKIKEVLGCN